MGILGWPSEEDRVYIVKKIIREKKAFINHLKKQKNPNEDNHLLDEKIKESELDLESYIKRNPIDEDK